MEFQKKSTWQTPWDPSQVLFLMARPEGFEPPAYWFVASCSIRAELRAQAKVCSYQDCQKMSTAFVTRNERTFLDSPFTDHHKE